jgi:phosphoglycolate phosphatase-like HAD superfamily hydrolase
MFINRKIKLFWDIDGTLLKTNGYAATPFEIAASEYLGQKVEINRKKLSGYTDCEIAKKLIESTGKKIDKFAIDKILEKYCYILPDYLKIGVVEPIGNIGEVLGLLRSFEFINLSLGTGNCLEGGKIKLQHVGLSQYFNMNDAFFASSANWSRELIMSQAKTSLAVDQIGIVIGDSPRDIQVAKKVGLQIIGVTTGAHNYNELITLKPDSILGANWDILELTNALQKIGV